LPIAILLVLDLCEAVELSDGLVHGIAWFHYTGEGGRFGAMRRAGARAVEVAQELDADAERGGQPAGAQPLRDGRHPAEDRRHRPRSPCRRRRVRQRCEEWGT